MVEQGRPCGAGGLRRHSKRGPIVYKNFFLLVILILILLDGGGLFFKRNMGGPRRPSLSPTRRTGPVLE